MITKKAIVDYFGTAKVFAEVIEVSGAGVSKWKDPLSRDNEDRAIAACIRAGVPVPKKWLAAVVKKRKLKSKANEDNT